MKHIHIRQLENADCPSVGVISAINVNAKFKKAIETHFDGELKTFNFQSSEVTSLVDCINAVPIDVTVTIKTEWEEESEYIVELSETFIYI